jgi:hypothetical protein
MKKLSVLAILLLAFVLAACSPAAPAAAPVPATAAPTAAPATAAPNPTAAPAQPAAAGAIPEIKIDASDFSYAAPETINAGWTRIALTNSGVEPHHVQFLRLNDGITVQQFEDALKQAEGPALALTKQVGGVGAIHPGGEASAVINLPAGEYVILCLIPSPSDHVAHHAKGMIKSLTVHDLGGVAAAAPKADMTVHMKDFAYDLPNALPPGPLTIQVVNDGPEPHELNILKLEDGKTLNDVMSFLGGAGGPPPFAPVGGMNGLDAGLTGYAEVNLPPGKYVAICNIPSPKAQGHPHSALGMVKEFTVAPSAAAFPTGTFGRTDDPSRGLQFNADGTFAALAGPTHLADGTYSVKGDVFTEESNNQGCPSPMHYKFTIDGANLKFSPVEDPAMDPCDGRKGDFNDAVTWVLKK